jgi:PAS domain S-box-containing protein
MENELKILYIDGHPEDAQEIEDFLNSESLKVTITSRDNFPGAVEYLESSEVDLIIADYQIGQEPIFDHLGWFNSYPWIVLTGHGSENIAAQSLKNGAVDYIVKDAQNSYLPLLLEALKLAPDSWQEQQKEGQHLQKLKNMISRKNKVLDESSQLLEQETLQRTRAMEELKESREIYRRFFQTSRDAVFIASMDGRWIDMNRSALDMFGYQAREQIWQDSLLDVSWKPEDQASFGKLIEEQGNVEDYAVTLKRKDGSDIEALISATAYEIGGRIIGYQGFIKDITAELKARKREQQVLKEQQALDRLSKGLASSLTPDEIYRVLKVQLEDLFEPDNFSVLKLSGEDGEFTAEFVWEKDDFSGTIFQAISLENPESPFRDVVFDQNKAVLLPGETARPDELENQGKNGKVPADLNGPGVDTSLKSCSMIAAPILADGELIAVLQLAHREQSVYNNEHLELLIRIANLVALGLQKAYLYQETRAHVEQLISLQRIEGTILENLSLPTTLDMLMDQLVGELAVDAADILYFHPQLQTLKFITQTGFRQNVLQHTDLEVGEGLAGIAAEARKIVQVANLKQPSEDVRRELEFSTEHFVSYCGVPLLAKGRLVGVMELFHRREFIPDQPWLDLLELIAGLAAIAIDHQNIYDNLKRSRNELSKSLDAIIEGWAQALELRGIESEGHWQRVGDLTVRLGKKLGLSAEDLVDLKRGALLHDIGKMGIPDEVLHKRTDLTKEERRLIGKHPVDAFELLKDVEGLKSALEIPLYHHERWDGTGYPYQLKGEDIPYFARIYAMVDVWDALRSDRPYRDALPYHKALKILKNEAGSQFDPDILPIFVEMLEEEPRPDNPGSNSEDPSSSLKITAKAVQVPGE